MSSLPLTVSHINCKNLKVFAKLAKREKTVSFKLFKKNAKSINYSWL
jgi:hypothetical protein